MGTNLGTSVRVLVVGEPTPIAADRLVAAVDSMTVETAATPEAAIESVSDWLPDCVVSAYELPERTGIELLAAVRETAPDLPFILCAETLPADVVSAALAAGATDCLRTDGDAEAAVDLLASRIDNAVGARRERRVAARPLDGADRLDETDREDTDDIGEYVVADRGVAERTQREAELRRHRDFLQDIQDIADIGGWELDLRTDRLQLTDEIYRILELPLETELSIDDALEFYHPDDVDRIQEAVDRLTTDGEPFDHECRIVTTTGAVRCVRVMGKPWRDDTGDLLGVHGAFQDITERTERQQELLTKSRALDEAPVGIAITDSTTDDEMVYVNSEFLELTGYPPEEVLGRNCRFLQGEGTQPEPVAELRSAIDNETGASVELRNYRRDGTMFWNHLEIAPIRDEDGEIVNYVGFQQDITERVSQKRALQKRERVLDELHASTRTFYPAESAADIASFLVEFIGRAFEYSYVSVKQFDEERGELIPAAVVSETGNGSALGPVAPGSNPIWQAYQRDESTVFDGDELPDTGSAVSEAVAEALVVPIGDFGVTVVFNTGSDGIDPVDVELVEVAAANAEAAFRRLHSDHVRSEISERLSAQQSEIDALTDSLTTLQAIHHRLADSDSQSVVDTAACEGLLDLAGVDFAWIGRPRHRETDIEPTEWAGDGGAYLDSVGVDEAGQLPAKRAAAKREQVRVPDISSRVLDEPWAKAALSAGYGSALSVPLVHDDVLYGVLSVYGRAEDAFDRPCADLLQNVASLVVTYSRMLDYQHAETGSAYIEREFGISGSTYPLQRLASATDSRIRFDAVAETTDQTVRILVTVVDGSPEEVLAAAAASTSVREAEPFGESRRQLSLTVSKPFLASVVGKHGGRLVGSVSEPSGTTVQVAVPEQAAKRPLVASLLSRYPEIELLAQRQTTAPNVVETTTASDLLTDRQHEILTAAYHGGYYETPRGVTGKALAESFGISSPTVYNHLQAAHRTLLTAIFDSEPTISSDTDGLNR